MNHKLEAAIRIAVRAHRGQVDKSGKAYILHPLRVMLSLTDIDHQIVGVLHDVIEDAPELWVDVSELDLPGHLDRALGSVTRRKDESYRNFILRAASDPIGRIVKIADIKDNLRPGCPPDLERRYREALSMLEIT